MGGLRGARACGVGVTGATLPPPSGMVELVGVTGPVINSGVWGWGMFGEDTPSLAGLSGPVVSSGIQFLVRKHAITTGVCALPLLRSRMMLFRSRRLRFWRMESVRTGNGASRGLGRKIEFFLVGRSVLSCGSAGCGWL